jgi:hypothetical protein
LARSHGQGRRGGPDSDGAWRRREGGPGSRQHSSAVEAGAGGANRVAFPGKGNRGGPHLEERGGEWAGLKEKIPGTGPR